MGDFIMRCLITTLCFLFLLATQAHGAWIPLAPGLDIGTFPAADPAAIDESHITILRIDPKHWELVLTGKSWNEGSENKTAKEWCKSHNLTAATNAGMFGTDYTTHIGYLASDGHVNNSHINRYMSVAAFNPKKGKGIPEFRIYDLDDPAVTMAFILDSFSSIVQNLRLIKRPGENRWGRQGKKWSEAALGEDSMGRALFIFSRTPFPMHDLNEKLLSFDLGLVASQHLEGGPEAQLYLRIGDVTRELFGRYETSFQDRSGNTMGRRVPNVLGIRPRPQ
jgi:hypothetical protein